MVQMDEGHAPWRLNGATRLFPIIGDPIVYAQSPERLTRSFAERGLNALCVPMQVPGETLSVVMPGLSSVPNIGGLLVTMPHKSKAITYCATLSEAARRLGSVSVMRRNPDETWHGGMLDGDAFLKAQIDAGARPKGARVLLIGAGGAGSAIALALLDAGVRELVLYDRNAASAVRLAKLLDADNSVVRIAAGPPDPVGFDMLCNASPMGMKPDDPPPFALDLVESTCFVGDVVAGHGETPLLAIARAKGCGTADGVQMVEAAQVSMLEFFLKTWPVGELGGKIIDTKRAS